VANKIDGETVPATHTTPDPLALNALLARMVEAGCEFCAMEVSSHAADQKRIAGLRFAGGIFTNLTRDHLDYHKTVARYLAAKKSFFDALPADAFALANADDRNGEVMMQNTRARRYTYALRSAATFRCRVIEDRLDGMLLALQGEPDGMLGQPAEVVTKFTGRFNAYNLAAVYGAAQLLGLDRGEALRLLSELHPVDGRMQRLMSPSGICAIVDYAHTPDALANALAALRQSATGRIITVTGAGGDRDKGKRPLMGAEAAKASDLLVITSDNPRHEDPADIAAEILAGVPDPSRAVTILDRAEAIAYAIGQARPGDAVLIAGKGHEDYQQIGDEKRHFDDREAVAAAFANLSNTKSPK
ncbi:MAG: UDP-N-acetylmuramoyl-L-alanyl-D-glutamate--2,6-diaminopimelate ligase, partial [Muribaculaceae bacterium]|nr:UDP-N-acetylmuramoyl-L-alanyl-D-glutamate--2,6-diaminopimelate ligase [Muribaculaceae bacterium]